MNQGGIRADLGNYAPDVEGALQEIREAEIVSRIWARDHTVWSSETTEILDRLGWLFAPQRMRQRLPELKRLAEEIKAEGFSHVVLAGMGGSSVGTEVLRNLLGPGEGYPTLLVLDSTFPGWIEGLLEQIDPKRTLFVISSKSGSTLETMCFYRFFRKVAEEHVPDKPERNFVAITCPGTQLDLLAKADGIREVVYNAEDVGSRYSGLSPLGLTPALLSGMDVPRIVEYAGGMAELCRAEAKGGENPGAWLGSILAVMATQGRDKLTLVRSASLEGFGLWVEQILSESMGKEGQGIVPIRGEPQLSADQYGPDRFFVFMQAVGDDDSQLQQTLSAVESSGHPWVKIWVEDLHQIGAEFFRWQFATAVAGAIMGIHPFNQPNVQLAKDMTDSVLAEFRAEGKLPERSAGVSVPELLTHAKAGGYVAVMAYARQTPEMDDALDTLRRRITDRYGVPVTLGYGPRILHSTGQMHKGGPNEGLFIQITCNSPTDFEIAGEDYSFGTLVAAQALADIRALRAIDRKVAHVHLDDVGSESLKGLANLAI